MNDFQNIIKGDLEKIESEYINIFEETNDVYRELNSFLRLPSKRIRSILGILYLKSQDTELDKNCNSILSVGEIFHNASLLHDDVIDDNDIRRGSITMLKKFNPKISVLSGDLLVSTAVKKLLQLNNTKISEIFLNCTEEMSKAEINQFILRGQIPDIDNYLAICKGKTSSLFKSILKALAVLKGLDQGIAERFGELFGLVFQIQNDLEENSARNDLKNGIYTIKDIIGIEKTISLVDNYKVEMRKIILSFPDNVYKKSLGDLTEKICLIRKDSKQA